MSLDYQRKSRGTRSTAPDGPDVTIRHTVNDARFLGIVMLILGTLILCVTCVQIRSAVAIDVMAGDSVFILLPATLYIVASLRIKLGVMAAGRLSMRISILQSIACVSAAIAAAMSGGRSFPANLMPFLAPSFVMCFLVPALLAQAAQLTAAINAMRLLPPVQPGFQIEAAPLPVKTIEQPLPVIPLDAAPLPVVPIDDAC